MMKMWFWWGHDLGDFLFAGLSVATEWAFALTWLALFGVALLFEGSKVYLARVQREAQIQFFPYRSDERRNLLCDREPPGANAMDASSTRNTTPRPAGRGGSLKLRLLVTAHQTVVFLSHNVVGYLLMLAVMLYNAYLLLAVVFGMMLGYFLFGTKLTRMQMQCFGNKRAIICTPECDDTAESSTPPLLTASISSESDLFICRTRTCIQPSHYFPSTSAQEPTCRYGAKRCPSRVARATRLQAAAGGSGKGPSVEDTQLLSAEKPSFPSSCCKAQEPPPPPPSKCCQSHEKTTGLIQDPAPSQDCCQEEREASPQVSCCHSKSVPTDSQERIVK